MDRTGSACSMTEKNEPSPLSKSFMTIDKLIDILKSEDNWPFTLASKLECRSSTIKRIMEMEENQAFRRRAEILIELHQARNRCSTVLHELGFEDLRSHHEALPKLQNDRLYFTKMKNEKRIEQANVEKERAETLSSLDVFVEQLAQKEQALDEVQKFMNQFARLFREVLGEDMSCIDEIDASRQDEVRTLYKAAIEAQKNITKSVQKLKNLIKTIIEADEPSTTPSKPGQAPKSNNQVYIPTWTNASNQGKLQALYEVELSGRDNLTPEDSYVVKNLHPDFLESLKRDMGKNWKQAATDISSLMQQTGQSKLLKAHQKDKINSAKAIFDVLQEFLGELDAKHEHMKLEIDVLHKEKMAAVMAQKEAEKKIEAHQKEAETFKTKTVELSRELKDLETRQELSQEEIALMQTKISALDNELLGVRAEVHQAAEKEKQKWLDTVRKLEHSLHQAEAKVEKVEDALRFERENTKMVQKKLNMGSENVEKLEKQVQSLSEKCLEFETTIEKLNEEIKLKQSSIDRLKKEVIAGSSPDVFEEATDRLSSIDTDYNNSERQNKFSKNLPPGAYRKIKGKDTLPMSKNNIDQRGRSEEEIAEEGMANIQNVTSDDPQVKALLAKLDEYNQGIEEIVAKETAKERQKLQAEAVKAKAQVQKTTEQLGDQMMINFDAYQKFSKKLQETLGSVYGNQMHDRLDELNMLGLKAHAEYNKVNGEYDKLINFQTQSPDGNYKMNNRAGSNSGQVQNFARMIRRATKTLNGILDNTGQAVKHIINESKHIQEKSINQAVKRAEAEKLNQTAEMNSLKKEEQKLNHRCQIQSWT